MSIIGFSNQGNLQQYSPSIWGDCLNTVLKDKGLGKWIDQDFLGDYTLGATTLAPGIIYDSVGTNVFGIATSSTFGPHVLSVATGATDNNHITLHGTEMIQIIRNSGKKAWFETRYAPTALDDEAFAMGFTTLANAVVAAGPIAANPSNSATATMTSASFIAFVSAQASSAIATVDAVYEKTTGTPVTVLANVTNATALTNFNNGLPSAQVITQAAAITAQGLGDIGEGLVQAVGNLTASGFRKYGIRFDGYTNLEFYVDGVKVATQTVDSTVDQAAIYVPFVAIKTGTAAASTGNVDFIRAGYQQRY